jgi:hypothetical protein
MRSDALDRGVSTLLLFPLPLVGCGNLPQREREKLVGDSKPNLLGVGVGYFLVNHPHRPLDRSDVWCP